MKQQFRITGMTCAACAAKVEKSVRNLQGMQQVQVNLLAATMSVEYDETQTNNDAIVRTVTHSGYGAAVRGAQAKQPIQEQEAQANGEFIAMKRRLIASICFLIPLVYVSMGHMVSIPFPKIFMGTQNAISFALTQLLLTLPICIINRRFFTNGLRSLLRRSPNMDSLIAIGAGAAVVYGVIALYEIGYGMGHGDMERVMAYTHDLYFESAGMILTLITLGKMLETRAKGKTGTAIAKLMDLAPKTATIEREGKEVIVPLEEVVVGDIFIVRPGQSVPVDGEIIQGQTAIDESALTGESMPAEKSTGDCVYAATVNKTGFVRGKASKVGQDTTLAQIIQLVEDAGASKAPIAKLADKVSGIFVPVVLAIALCTVIVWLALGASVSFALSVGIAVLVISCPCALGLATPVAIMVGTGVGAEHGVLFKSAQAMETLSRVKTVVLDKTGTVTWGHPRVTDVISTAGVTPQELLTLAVSLEQPSEHPLAEAIVQYAKEQGVTAQQVQHFQAQVGQGITAEIDGIHCFAGNARMLVQYQLSLDTSLQRTAEGFAQEGKTPLFFAKAQQVIGMIAVSDVVKPTSKQAIAALRNMHIDVVMLTGDNAKTAAAIQKTLDIPKVIAEVLPQDKEREIRALQENKQRVAMIGDGINDAPALARADVGIAIGAGTDIAIASADVVLMKSDLLDAVDAIRLSRAALRNIRQNLFWAFFYNVIGIPLAAGVFFVILNWKLNPMFAAAAMSLSSFCVVMNALRLYRFRATTRMGKIEETQKGKDEKQMITMQIEGMMCAHCEKHVKDALLGIAGVEQAQVSHQSGQAVLETSAPVSHDTLKEVVQVAGYQVREIGET